MQGIPLILVALAILTGPACAQTWERKFARGVSGMTLGFLEVPGNMTAESEARGLGEGLPFGFAKGLGMLVVRELVGVYEFTTTPFEAPDGFQPILQPEFPWSYFTESTPVSSGDVDTQGRAPDPRNAGSAVSNRPYVPTWRVVRVSDTKRSRSARRRVGERTMTITSTQSP